MGVGALTLATDHSMVLPWLRDEKAILGMMLMPGLIFD
jgi:hypothetical protein